MALLAGLLALPVLVLTAPAAQACSCVGGTVEDHLDLAGLVAEVEVVGSRATDRANWGTERAYTVEVLRSWKGDPAARLVVTAPTQEGACGLSLPADGRYLLLATRSESAWHTNSCLGEVSEGVAQPGRVTVAQVEAELGEGSVPAPGTEETVARERPSRLVVGGGLVAVIAAGLALVVGVRRLRRVGH